jgi:hypothetical protein
LVKEITVNTNQVGGNSGKDRSLQKVRAPSSPSETLSGTNFNIEELTITILLSDLKELTLQRVSQIYTGVIHWLAATKDQPFSSSNGSLTRIHLQ